MGKITTEEAILRDYIIKSYQNFLEIDKVIFNNPATIVFWKDGTKTVVKAFNEPFDKEKGIAIAFLKKAANGGHHKIFKKWIKD